MHKSRLFFKSIESVPPGRDAARRGAPLRNGTADVSASLGMTLKEPHTAALEKVLTVQ